LVYLAQMLPIHDVSDWIAERPEALGSKEKFWLLPPPESQFGETPCLFKVGRPDTGENWAELACCEFLKSLEIPCANYHFAIYNGRRGVISERFFARGGSFIPANMILSKLDPEYDGSIRFKQARYKILTAVGMLRNMHLRAPLEFQDVYPHLSAHGFFIGYLFFDALVGNTDRHHENWGVMVVPEGGRAIFKLAPSFDHASSLGRDQTDETRRERLNTRDLRYSVEGYAERARSAFYGLGRSGKALKSREVVTILADSFPDPSEFWAEKLTEVDLSEVVPVSGTVWRLG